MLRRAAPQSMQMSSGCSSSSPARAGRASTQQAGTRRPWRRAAREANGLRATRLQAIVIPEHPQSKQRKIPAQGHVEDRPTHAGPRPAPVGPGHKPGERKPFYAKKRKCPVTGSPATMQHTLLLMLKTPLWRGRGLIPAAPKRRFEAGCLRALCVCGIKQEDQALSAAINSLRVLSA